MNVFDTTKKATVDAASEAVNCAMHEDMAQYFQITNVVLTKMNTVYDSTRGVTRSALMESVMNSAGVDRDA
jgi:hypothetical protein